MPVRDRSSSVPGWELGECEDQKGSPGLGGQ